MNKEIETIAKEYFELKEKIKVLERRRSELKEVLFTEFDSNDVDEVYTEDVHVYRVNRPKISWNETILKSILAPKGLWKAVLRVENKKVRDLIENGLISESELEEAKATRDMWYTYAEQVSLMEQTNASHSTPTGTEVGGVKRLIITDLSRMKEGRICIVGIDREYNVIRPVIPYSGVKEDYILDETGKLIITPFAEIEFKFIRPLSKSPHAEDWELDTNYRPRLIGRFSEEAMRGFLERISYRSVREIFGTAIHEGRYTNPGDGNRSLGTVKSVKVMGVNYSMKEDGTYKYRITFSDMGENVYNLPVTDCAFRRYCDRLRVLEGRSTNAIGLELQQRLNQRETFLRVGLTRPFAKMHNRCYLQVSGIHAFPDYKEKDQDRGEIYSGKSKAYSGGNVRKLHPRAYEQWTEEDDERLITERQSGKTIEELMELFGRQKGGIESRLRKLGLLS
ncbi:MAG: hypothetical protein U9N09_07880 [Euryarchaeota archaeon]|nr:hypothetical protein [Euryarchaeota archaeon]